MRAKRLPTFRSVCFLGAGRDFVFRCIACFPRRKQGFRALCEVSGSVSAERSGSFGQLGQARTAADSLGQGKAGNELPQNCRRFSVSDAAADGISALRPGKTFRLPPTLDALKRSAFYALREGREPPGKKNALRGISRLWRVCAKIAHTRPAEFSAQAKQAARMLPGV